ncbi:hypothetical protein ABC345_20760 [Shouchella sp. 1P09AA]|uniref:hypothetical protein n=1 Tax=unclassified Shouchella TaxID=2893065 RepID=UPI0039A1A88E
MYGFNRWTYTLTIALICGSVYLTLSYFNDDQLKWLNALILTIALFITWLFIYPRFFKNREDNQP